MLHLSRYGLKWKQLYELFDKKKEMLEKELNDEKQKLEEQIEYAKYQHETELLRESEYCSSKYLILVLMTAFAM